jgi:HEAT repeat protein
MATVLERFPGLVLAGVCVGIVLPVILATGFMQQRTPSDTAPTPAVIDDLREVVQQRGPTDVRLSAVVELARSSDRTALPILVATIEDDDELVAGRAIAAIQHLLGVRYPLEEWPLDKAARRRIAAMAREDMVALDGPGKAWWETHTKQPARR